MTASCHLCGSPELQLLPAFSRLHRVSSDCKPWPAGGGKACCTRCGGVQSVIDAQWKSDCDRIYSVYAVYHQGGGQEQQVFDTASSAGTPRSAKLLEKLVEAVDLPAHGRAIDIGCGNGNFIRSFAAIRPQWRLNGAEYNTLYEAQVRAIPGVEGFFSGSLETIPGPFDFVSLIHVLEHIENPVEFLKKIAWLAPHATLLIEVPYFRDNPYELLIADHATHYTPAVLANVLCRAGYTVRSVHTDWIKKEISAVAVATGSGESSPAVNPAEELSHAAAAVAFLEKVRERARQVRAESGRFGIFGTSIGGTWLHSELGGQVDFFVDEDSSRIGKEHLGVEILSPAQVSPGSAVFMPLAAIVAESVARRLGKDSVRYTYCS